MKNYTEFQKMPLEQRRRDLLEYLETKNYKLFELICLSLRKDESQIIRHEACFLLGSSRKPEAIRYLINAIRNDHSPLVKHEAIEALGDLNIKTPEVFSILNKIHKSSKSFIKETAEMSLKMLGAN